MIETESRVLELASEALNTFCQDISCMYEVDMKCEQREITTRTVAQLKKRFKKLVAVNIVDSEGILDGTFQLIFDQEGLFTVGGVMVMLPEKGILANRKVASADLAEGMVDAIGEAGNLLVAAWERIFQEQLQGRGHLSQRLPAFVGKPWDKPQEKIGLSPDKEHIFIPCEMTISPYPAFNCGMVFPRTILEGNPASDSDDAGPDKADVTRESQQQSDVELEDKPKTADAKKEDRDAKPTAKKRTPKKSQAARKKATKKARPEETPAEKKLVAENRADPAAEVPDKEAKSADRDKKARSSEAVDEDTDSKRPDKAPVKKGTQQKIETSAEQTDVAPGASDGEEPGEERPETPETSEEPATGPVSGAIKEMARLQIDGTSELLWISARDIMQTRVVWANPDESVQQALVKLQQNDAGYLAVGSDEVLEGIISKADVAGAMSPYLRPMFAKWRKPSDDATLRIKLKWIMSRPVRTAGLDTPLASLLENMCRFGGRALPVVDEQGKVHGLVTAFDIFQMLLSLGADVPTAGKAAQGPPL